MLTQDCSYFNLATVLTNSINRSVLLSGGGDKSLLPVAKARLHR